MKEQFIWEYVLANSSEDIQFEQAEKWNLCNEIVSYENGVCLFNSMFRYGKIFLPYMKKYGIPKTQKDKVIFDICIHFLTMVDVHSGCTYRELCKREFENDINKGIYGKQILETFNTLSMKEKHLVIHYLELQSRIATDGNCDLANIYIFQKIILQLLQSGILYKDRQHKNKYILYVGLERSEEKQRIISMVKDLFLPLSCNLEVLWDKHFGIFGEPQTLFLDNIRLM